MLDGFLPLHYRCLPEVTLLMQLVEWEASALPGLLRAYPSFQFIVAMMRVGSEVKLFGSQQLAVGSENYCSCSVIGVIIIKTFKNWGTSAEF